MTVPGVLFLPGFMQHADAWSRVAGAVGERYPVKVLDFATWTAPERVAEIAAAAEPGAVVVGYSMGGRLALRAALADPARFGALVLIGASAGISDDAARAARLASDRDLADWIEAHSAEEVVDRWERNPVFATQNAAMVAAQRAGRLAHSPPDLARLLRSAGQGAFEPVWDRLASLPMPVVAVAGSHDVGYGETARRIAALAPRGLARIVPEAGHAVHLERPDAVRDIVFEVVEGIWSL